MLLLLPNIPAQPRGTIFVQTDKHLSHLQTVFLLQQAEAEEIAFQLVGVYPSLMLHV